MISDIHIHIRTFTMLRKPNSTAKPSRSVRIIVNVMLCYNNYVMLCFVMFGEIQQRLTP